MQSGAVVSKAGRAQGGVVSGSAGVTWAAIQQKLTQVGMVNIECHRITLKKGVHCANSGHAVHKDVPGQKIMYMGRTGAVAVATQVVHGVEVGQSHVATGVAVARGAVLPFASFLS